MSSVDYDQAEKLFCGTWKNVANDNLEAFMTAAEISDALKEAMREENRTISIVRDGESFHYKTNIGGVDVDFTEKMGEQAEWEEKEKNPILHIRITPTFKDGVWVQDCTPVEPGDGKRYLNTLTRHEEEMYWDLSLPDDPSVTARRHWKKC